MSSAPWRRRGTTSTSASATRSTPTARCPATNPVALTVEQKWAKYELNLGEEPLADLRGAAGFYSHWDDHEFINDFSPFESVFSSGTIDGRELYERGVKAFTDYAPVDFSSRDGLYRTTRWGKNLELFFLDERSFRSAKASKDGVCDNPQTPGAPDLAPTAPQSVRDAFAVLIPSLAAPVSQACLDAISDPDRTLLGDKQLKTFLHDVEHSQARFKVVVNEVPIQQFYALPYDRWEGYEAERQRVLSGLQGVNNVVFLTTDVHATLVNDARFKTLEPGGPQNSGILDVTVGPAATAPFAQEINDAVGLPFAAGLIDSLFFERRARNAVFGHQPVQLRRGRGDQHPAHDHPQGHRRQPVDDRRRSLRAVRLELPALTQGEPRGTWRQPRARVCPAIVQLIRSLDPLPTRRVGVRRTLFVGLIAGMTMAFASAADAKTVDLTVLSSQPNQVSGGDALVRVDAPPNQIDTLRVERNGVDVTAAFSKQGGALVGVVDGLALGKNELAVVDGSTSRRLAQRKLFNYPTAGPIFSGPHQEFFVCNTIQAGLGEPLVDNQAGQGFRVLNPDGSTAGWSLDCSANTRVDYLYRTTTGSFQPLPGDGSRPANMAQTTLLDGRTVDYVVRRERGTIDRFIYSFAMLAPFGEQPGAPDTSLWNRRAIYTFDGGVQIGHRQGTPGGSALYDPGLSKGYAIIHSSGNRTSTTTTSSSAARRR